MSPTLLRMTRLGHRATVVRRGAAVAVAGTAALAPQQWLALMSRRTGEVR